MEDNKMKNIFIGTSLFAEIVLNEISQSVYAPFLVVTSPDRPANRGQKINESPVSLKAKELKIETLKPEKISEIKERIKREEPELIIVCSYGQKIPQDILEIPKKNCLNIHPSLLPLYRGPSPITQAIINGDQETGVTIIVLNQKIDAGMIINQEKVSIKKDTSLLDLSQELALKGSKLLLETIPLWIDNKIIGREQDESRATSTKTMEKQDGLINWNDSAQEIERKVRALNPWPGTFSFFKDPKTREKKTIKILEAGIQEQTQSGPFGVIGQVYLATNNELAVQTSKDFLIIKKLQIENKNSMTTQEFINGNIDFIGTILE
jgi:methionyl-tRNA formyltransferase